MKDVNDSLVGKTPDMRHNSEEFIEDIIMLEPNTNIVIHNIHIEPTLTNNKSNIAYDISTLYLCKYVIVYHVFVLCQSVFANVRHRITGVCKHIKLSCTCTELVMFVTIASYSFICVPESLGKKYE